MKDKRFLTGLGFGLIVGAILLQLMNVAASGAGDMVMTESGDAGENRQYTVQELTDIADELGYKIYDRDEKRYTEQEAKELVRTAIEKERGKSDKQDDTPAPAKEEQLNPEAPAKAEQPEEQQPAEKESFSLSVKSGMSSDQVADALVKAKLMDDSDAFKNELNRRKLTNKIQVGEFTFDKKPSLSELIDKITKP